MSAPALVVMPRLPWPADDGGRVALWQTLEGIARARPTTLVALVPPGPVPKSPACVGELGIEVLTVEHRPTLLPLALVRGVLGRWPMTLSRFRSPGLARLLSRLVRERKPKFVVFNNLHMATYFDSVPDIPRVLRQQNLEYLWLERFSKSRRNPLSRSYFAHQAARMRRAEAELCRRMDLVLAIQETEAAAMRQLVPETRIETVPVGMNFDRAPARRAACPPVIMVLGSLDRAPNAEGARQFLEAGWPVVQSRIPGARLRVIGRQMPDSLRRLALSRGAEPVGFVSNLQEEWSQASAMVVPIWIGAGVRVKTVEAIAARVPVVATAVGVEGLGLTHGLHFVGDESAAGLGRAAVDLLARPDRGREIADAAYAFALPRFGLEAVLERTSTLCERAAESTRSKGALAE